MSRSHGCERAALCAETKLKAGTIPPWKSFAVLSKKSENFAGAAGEMQEG